MQCAEFEEFLILLILCLFESDIYGDNIKEEGESHLQYIIYLIFTIYIGILQHYAVCGCIMIR